MTNIKLGEPQNQHLSTCFKLKRHVPPINTSNVNKKKKWPDINWGSNLYAKSVKWTSHSGDTKNLSSLDLDKCSWLLNQVNTSFPMDDQLNLAENEMRTLANLVLPHLTFTRKGNQIKISSKTPPNLHSDRHLKNMSCSELGP